MTSIVVIIGAAASGVRPSGLPSESSVLESFLRGPDDAPEVSLISLGFGESIEGLRENVDLSTAGTPPLDRLLRALGAFRLRSRLAASPIGRLLNSVGPLDQGRVFWRLVRRDPEAMRALRDADIAIAADNAAVKTAWIALRRKWVESAHYDHRAIGVGVTIPIPAGPDRDDRMTGPGHPPA